jgi:hypothetical protein
MKMKSLATGLIALCLALVTLMGVGTAGASSQYTAWDKGGNSYVSTVSQAAAKAAAAAWNTSHHYTSTWTGFVMYGTSQKTATQTAGVLQFDATNGSFWIATSQSGAVFTSYVSQVDVQSKAASDLNPLPTPFYTAISSAGITYTSAVSQANADAMATFVEHTAVPHYFGLGINGTVTESTVSSADASSQTQAELKANPYSAGAGDYIGYDATSGNTNPADMIAFLAPTQAAANALAQAWGKALVHGGVWIATSPVGSFAFASSVSQAAATAEAGSYSGYFPGFATLQAGVDFHSASATNVTYYSGLSQQMADNMAAFTHYKTRPLPTVPEVCYQGSKSNTLSLLSWQCPAHWTMLRSAEAPARITCVKDSVVRHIIKVNPACPVGWKKK